MKFFNKSYLSFDPYETLEIKFDGPKLDAYTLARLNLDLHYISNKIALFDSNLYNFPFLKIGKYYPYSNWEQPQLIKLQIDEIKSGSFNEVVIFAVSAILSDAGARAILQGLATNIIWAISASGLRGIVIKSENNRFKEINSSDPFEIGPRLAETIKHLSNNSDNNCKLKFKSKSSNGEVNEIEININNQE